METIRDYLIMLKEEQREQAFKNVENCPMQKASGKTYTDVLSEKRFSFPSALLGAFDWDETPEGVDYWVNIYKNPKEFTLEEFHNNLI